MTAMLFTPSGLFQIDWDGDLRKEVTSVPSDERILSCLRNSCTIEDGTTLLDIFKAVDGFPTLKLFIAQYSWCWHIEEFHQQAQWPNPETAAKRNIEYLEVYRHAQADKYKADISFSVDIGFHGIGDPSCEKDKFGVREDGKLQYSVSYCPLWEISRLPVRINPECTIYSPWTKGESPKKLLHANDGFVTLLEFLDAIYDDISFVGGPGDKADFIEGMNATIEGVQSGEIETVPLQDLIDSIQEDLPKETDKDES